jgi:sec-independent protein translocase protein TatA
MGVGVLQPWHVIVILVIVLVIFGPGKLPMLGKAVGDTVRDFKKAVSDEPAKPNGTTTATAELTPGPGTRPCPTCQKPVAIGDRFCGACGSRQDVAAV